MAMGEWLARALSAARARRAGKEGLGSQEELDRMLHGAARDGDCAAVESLIAAGARGGVKGWGGRDALAAAMRSMSPRAGELALMLAPVSDPKAVDDQGAGALAASMGQPWHRRLRPVDQDGREEPWAAAFWSLLPWADLEGAKGFDALRQAIESDWPRAARALAERSQWGARKARASRVAAIASALARAPELALAWAREGRGKPKEWEAALAAVDALPEERFMPSSKAVALARARSVVEARSMARLGEPGAKRRARRL